MNSNPWATIRFTLPILPRGQSRTQASVITDGSGKPVRSKKNGRFVLIHRKSDKQQLDEERLSALLMEHRPERPLKGPIKLGIKAFFPLPKTVPDYLKAVAPERGKYAWFRESALSGYVQPESKPDLDNIFKNFKDVATGIFWGDDSRIVGFLDGSGKYFGDVVRYEITILYLRDRQGGIY